MRKIIIIALSVILIAGIIGTGAVVLAKSGPATPNSAVTDATNLGQLTKIQVLRRLLLIQDEAKVDSLLARAVTDGKLTSDQVAKVKTFWTNNHAMALNLVKAVIAKRVLNVKDEATLKGFLDNQVVAKRLTPDQQTQIINFWQNNHK